jgi:APA family basic amino acid/polyamine antiporter
MAEDRLFFKSVAWVHPKTHVPAIAIALQGLLAIVIALSGRYEQILNYVVSVDFIFFGLTAMCIFIFRKRQKTAGKVGAPDGGRIASVPGHPLTTILFVASCWLVVINTVYKYPGNTLIGLALLLIGIPAYFFWRWKNRI